VVLAWRFYFGPPFGLGGKETRVLRLAKLDGQITQSQLRSFLEGKVAGLLEIKILRRKDGSRPGIAHLSFSTGECALAAKQVDWKALQSQPLEAQACTEAAATEESRKEETTNKRTLVDEMVQEAATKVGRKGIEDPWGYTLGKQAYDAIVNLTKTYEGRPAISMVNVEVGHLLAFRHARYARFPRIVCRVVDIRHFRDVAQMLREIGWRNLVPWVQSEGEAEAVYQALGKDYRTGMKSLRLQYLRTETQAEG
jgi:ASC-1-like (ASCH) protein